MIKATPIALNLNKKQYQQSDEALVRSIIHNGDAQLFDILYDRYYPFVKRHCLRFFKNKQDLEDVSQDIFFNVLLKLDTFSFKSKFSTWLYSFVQNYCINYTKSIKYRKWVNPHIDIEKLNPYFLNYNYDSTPVKYQQLTRLKHALCLLSKHEQQLILMKYCGHFSIKELSDFFGLKEGAIKMKLKRIKEKVIRNYREIDIEELNLV